MLGLVPFEAHNRHDGACSVYSFDSDPWVRKTKQVHPRASLGIVTADHAA